MQQQLTRPNTPSQLLEFTLTGQISYYNEDFEPSEIIRKDTTPDGNLRATKDGHSNVGAFPSCRLSSSARTSLSVNTRLHSYYKQVLPALAWKQ
jgi:hypothetical protein